MKDWIGLGLALIAIGIVAAPLLFARHLMVQAHKQQFKATGGAEFPLPSHRAFEAEEPEPAARPRGEETQTDVFSMDLATSTIAAKAQEIQERTLLSTETGELVRLGPDGLPLSPADLSARTAPTDFTVDPERLAEILTLESTAEYAINPGTWAEITAAEAFMRDPLGSAVLPPLPLTEEAGNPGLEMTFYTVLAQGGLRHDWNDADSEFHFWDVETALEPVAA